MTSANKGVKQNVGSFKALIAKYREFNVIKVFSIHVLLHDGRSALHWASNNVKVVEVLLYAGADINLGETVRLCVHIPVFSDTL